MGLSLVGMACGCFHLDLMVWDYVFAVGVLGYTCKEIEGG